MERKSLLAVSAATIIIALIAFSAGRQSATFARADSGASEISHRDVFSSPVSSRPSEETDFSKLKIENIGQIGFDHAYELLRAAPPEALMGWAAYLETLPKSPAQTAAITSFYRILAQSNTKAAVDLVLNSKSSEQRNIALAAISASAPASRFADVSKLIVRLHPYDLMVVNFVEQWSRSDPAAAAEFARSFPQEVNSNAVNLLLTNWAAVDPDAAKTWLDQLEPSRQDPDAYEGLVSGWFENDRPAALDYLVRHAGDKNFEKSVENEALFLFMDASESARAFVMDLPPGAAMDAAIDNIAAHATQRFVYSSVDISPDTVAKWLVTMPQEIWDDHLGYVVAAWRGKNPAEAEHWLNSMSVDVRDQIAAKFSVALDWDNPQENFEAAFSIHDRVLREETLKKILSDRSGDTKRLLKRAKLSPQQQVELKRIGASL